MKRLALAGLLLLGGCSFFTETVGEILPSYDNKIAALESTYEVANEAGVAYIALPTCKSGGAVLCKQLTVVGKIAQADDAAYKALKAARSASSESTFSAAQTAITAFQVVVNANTGATK